MPLVCVSPRHDLVLHNNALDLHESLSQLGLHKMPLVCVNPCHDLVCITMPLVCVNPYHDLVCINALSLSAFPLIRLASFQSP